MSSAAKILPHYTYDEWKEWKDRWELIEGVPYAMSPAPSPRHQWISANIKYELKDGIKKKGCKNCKVYDFIDLKISEDTILQPDAVVVCGEILKNYLDFPAAMVVEVLSPATALKDRNNKLIIYESQRIPYYLIVDIEKEEIEIYRLSADGKYVSEPFSPQDPYSFELDKDCSVKVTLAAIWE